MDIVFNETDKYCDLSTLTGHTIDDRRKCQFAYVIFPKSRAFLDSLKKWNPCPSVTKTYDRMIDFMCDERKALEAVDTLTIQDSLNQVEMLKAIQNQQDELTQRLEERMQINLVNALAQYGHMERNELQHIPSYTEPNANAVQHTPPLLGDTALQ